MPEPKDVLSDEKLEHLIGKIEGELENLRKREIRAVVPFVNGDFTAWDLYLAASCEQAVRLIDGMRPMLEGGNVVCTAVLLRTMIGVCLRTFALFVVAEPNAFLEDVFLKGGRVDKHKDRKGKKLADGRLKELLSKFDPRVKGAYDETSGYIHYSSSILPTMGTTGDDSTVEFNFGCKPNPQVNAKLVEFGFEFCHFVDPHLQMLAKVVASDDWYDGREILPMSSDD